MEKCEYLTGEDLGYKPYLIQRAKLEYSPLGEAFNKAFKKSGKNKKVRKHDNDLVYTFVQNFNKYSVSSFNEISSIDCKFVIINKFYKDFLKLNDVKSQKKKNYKTKKSYVKK